MNSIGDAVVEFFRSELDSDSKAVRNYAGFVITTDAAHFSVGVDIRQLLGYARNSNWENVERMIQHFQDMTQAVKFCHRPVVSAIAGLCLGGGCEIALHSAGRQTHLELSAGLVETGVGLIPGCGGCKEMLLRALRDDGHVGGEAVSQSPELLRTLQDVFQGIVSAKVSTSAHEARDMRLLSAGDRVSMNRARLLSDAKLFVSSLANSHYAAPLQRRDIPCLGTNVLASLEHSVYLLHQGQFISDYDLKIAMTVAKILCGGDVTPGSIVNEQYFLELEREAFIMLCGEKKTQARMEYTLNTGKPLRN